ncbi:purine-nucleoside phosphorylase [Novipirellula artificiosorum]|uniref:Purine nucleoside phosphorylase n=1 Tax=Novipirellula artificiosorum TaxID=2528016 RepID=A0A5C6DM54_9BACT|nr:purine-nucleoside phosphorylase [Novipirellula artificiosorum]TWU35939.1 Purine nucleoside phosphorylase 1 [Novipirellula artificiosorum]
MIDHQNVLNEACAFIRDSAAIQPAVAMILGSGLGGVAKQIERPTTIDFADIAGFAASTASGHQGQLILGELEQQPVIAMAGRLHCYEGWNIDQVTFPVHVMAALGASRLIVSNAAGGVNPKLRVGDLLVIRDHMDWIRGVSKRAVRSATGSLGRRVNLYDDEMSAIAIEASRVENFLAMQGTYLATLGPNYETRAEYRMMRRVGADVVGMSTVPEVLAAASSGMRTLGLSLVSNVARPDAASAANHDEVLAAGKLGQTKLESIVRTVLRSFT